MKISNAVYSTPDHKVIQAEVDGELMVIPISPDDIFYAEILKQNVRIAPYAGPRPEPRI